jgi:uncharacterized metal-binding protein
MPSGKTHDKLTVVTAVLSLPIWYLAAPAQDLSSYAAGLAGYVVSGFYLSGDLDTRSAPLRRWGPFQFIWYPYQRLVPHRSWLSHGIGIGPIVRTFYLAAAVWVLARALLYLIDEWIVPVDRNAVLARFAIGLATLVWRHPIWAEWALAGLILGGVTHTIADAVVSGFKKVW